MLPIKIIGTGVYAPGEPIDNIELKRLANIEFEHEKTEAKLGIYTRHIAHLRGINETTADFATKAAENAITDSGLSPSDIGLFIVATDTPEFITPATSILVQGRIQKGETWASTFDVSASCASFAIALDNAARIMATDESIEYAVVIGVYNMPAFIRPGDAFGYTIFADGAGAFVLQRVNGSSGYIAGQLLTDGTQWDYVGVYAGGSKNPITSKVIKEEKWGLLNLQRLPGDRNVRLWPMVVEKLLAKANRKIEEVDHFIFTQINRSVIMDVMAELNQPESKTNFVMDRYGYTGSGCLPMAFHHAVKEGKVKRGDRVIMVASGAGLAVGSNIFLY
ncbi:MAG: ketoacyl-ACP synthase III [Bacteroidales bacterium]|jgi:3-oxoacyl-[acyl-carrier-protein] synthase-3|nr:ketoacyl-ACP synthase III [Bacteroidales bacterium]MDD4385197.1 ketoacyl-ACP synthase III [Bacteroidales bacterium]MDY0197908.1 ketoacyl-ACP synthase III [Tenuifilaceae bacterium]